MKNKKGAMSGGMVILLIVLAIFAYTTNLMGLKDLVTPAQPVLPIPPTSDNCPSSGLSEITLNAQEALASTATNANVSYYIYDNGVLVKSGDTGSDGTVSVDVACGKNKKYTMLVLNEKTLTGFYPQTIIVDASGPTGTHNLKMYEYGQIHVANLGSSSDPTGAANMSSGTGKNCGFEITFSNNESASGFNKPLIMCMVNSTAVVDVTMNEVTEVLAKKPIRVSSISNHQYYTFELNDMVESTDAAIKLSGKIQFSSSATIPTADTNNMSCIVVDQASFKLAEYKTLSLNDGFVEAAENTETITDIGAPDSNRATIAFAGSYC